MKWALCTFCTSIVRIRITLRVYMRCFGVLIDWRELFPLVWVEDGTRDFHFGYALQLLYYTRWHYCKYMIISELVNSLYRRVKRLYSVGGRGKAVVSSPHFEGEFGSESTRFQTGSENVAFCLLDLSDTWSFRYSRFVCKDMHSVCWISVSPVFLSLSVSRSSAPSVLTVSAAIVYIAIWKCRVDKTNKTEQKFYYKYI